MLFVDAGIGKIVDSHAVSEADTAGVSVTLVEDGEIVVMVVSAEDALHTVSQARLEDVVRAAAAEYAVGANTDLLLVGLTHIAINKRR